MADYTDIKRKHSRFPAYSDETGVKLPTEERTPFSEENWILTKEEERPLTQKKTPEENRSFRRSARNSQEKAGQSIQQREELKHHRENLPDYATKHEPEVKVSGKKRLFGDQKNQHQTIKVQNRPAKPANNSLKREYSGRSYFVPKYIPASSIPDKKDKEISDQELLRSMTKDSDQYLRFDSETSAFQQKKEGAPSVQKFHHQEKSEPVSMTRGQYKTSKKNKSSVLDRSLKGVIEENNSLDSTSYFK